MLAKQGRDFVALNLPEEVSEASPAHSRAPHAIFCLVLMVALMLTDEIPNPVAAIIACLLMGNSAVSMPKVPINPFTGRALF